MCTLVSGGIDFMFAQAEFGEVTFHDLIKMLSLTLTLPLPLTLTLTLTLTR